MIGGEKIEVGPHCDQVRVRVTDGEGRQLASLLLDLSESFELHAQLTDAQLRAHDHQREAGAA